MILKKFISHIKKKEGQPWVSQQKIDLRQAWRAFWKVQKLDFLEKLKVKQTLGIIKAEWSLQEASEDLQKVFIDTLIISQKKSAQLLLNDFGVGADFLISDEIALEYAQNRAGEMITAINATTEKTINWIITKGIEQWADYTQIADAIQDKFVDFSKYRAELIAVNEIWNAYETGKVVQATDYWIRTNQQMVKRWVTQWDDRVTDECESNEGDDWINLESSFSSGDDQPPRFPWCRCYLKHKTKEMLLI